MRQRLDPIVESGTVPCARCGELIEPGTPWQLGRKIVFERRRGLTPNSDLYVMNADGSDQRRLTRNSGGGIPRWSPDGRRIAFLRQELPKGGSAPPAPAYVYVMNADGSGPRRLARMAKFDYSLPSWSTNGRKIVFVSERDGNPEVYVVNVDGSGKRNLTRHPPRVRRRSCLVAQRAEDRLRYQARRQLRGLRHERGRQRAAELNAQPGARSLPVWSPVQKK
jgi:dipeptidyl aminopeptidase/acylaminoacyl peptidase